MTEKNQIHPYVNVLYEQLENRRIGRRDFLRTATLLGLSASAAYAIAGMGGDPGLIPSARAQEPGQGRHAAPGHAAWRHKGSPYL